MQQIHLFFLLATATLVVCTEFHYDEGGADWADNEWQCLSGASQSPINIDTTIIPPNEKYQLTLKKAAIASDVKMVNNGHSIQADYPWIQFEATNVQGQVKQYEAVQLHFHSPSEHAFDNKLADLEVHIVCKQIEGPSNGYTYGVFTFVFTEGDVDSPFVEPFSAAAATFASSAAESVTISPNLYENLNKVLPGLGQLGYYTYQGSLTTPPCTQIVEWYIIKQALPISTAQLKNFQNLWPLHQEFAEGKGNNRVVQALNGRTIIEGQAWNKLEISATRIISYSLFSFVFILLMIWL